MPGDGHNGNPPVPSSRVGSLPRERELKKSSRASQSNDNSDAIIEQSRQGDNLSNSFVNQYLEGADSARGATAEYESQDDGPARQRLLVAANRLPVSAFRRGEESWSLEMSAGGLVSALLGVNMPDEPGQRSLRKALAEKVRCTPFPSSEIRRTLPSLSELSRFLAAVGGVSASQLSSNDSVRSFEEGTKNGHRSAEKNQLSVQILDTAIKKVSSADSSVCSVPDSSRPGSKSSKGRKKTKNSHSSKRKGTCLQTATTQPDSNSMESEKIALGKVSTGSVIFNLYERKIQDYGSSQKMLLVGEGDFSFSACLAKAFGSATNMVATSLNSEEYLRKYYGKAMGHISQLRERDCVVLHEVDATDVANHGLIKLLKYDRIIYNFPHCGEFSDSEEALRKNRRLVRLFMENSAKLITKDGEIHIRHKFNWFFERWNLNELASRAGLKLKKETSFNASVFPGYTPKYGFEGVRFNSDEDFDYHSSCTYKFVLRPKKLRQKNNKSYA